MLSGGFVYLDELVRRIPCTVQWVHHLVATDAKNRFALWADEVGRHTIRANQGHSIDKPQSGTCFVRGPSCHPWHNNVRMEAHPASGIRNSSEVLIYVHARTALEAGLKFYRSQNNVILSPGDKQGIIPSCYFSQVVHRISGAGDNTISCAVMLEMLRVLSQTPERPLHNIIFLFNGAEENLLQASHGFITTHPWAKSIRVFVNTDSAGAGGKEVVFQTGPAHPWLVRAYAQSAEYPAGSVVAQDLFQSGIIPGETDYRIYRDFGEIPGIDIAYISNGYVYHTRNDLARFIQPGCIQRGGDNLLALIKNLASSPRLADPGEDKHGSMVFFDLVGTVMVYYPQRVGLVINCAMVAAVFVKILRKIFYMDSSAIQGMDYARNLTCVIVCIVLTWLVCIVTCVAMAMAVTLLGVNMFWFTHTVNMVPIYSLPALAAMIILHEVILKPSKMFSNKSGWQMESLYFEGNLVIWSLVTLLTTVYGLGSAFIPMLYILGPLVLRDRTLQWLRDWNFKDKPGQLLLLHLVSISVPALVVCNHIFYPMLLLFVPIMGRLGAGVNSDLVIGILNAFMVIVLAGYMIGFIYISKQTRQVIYTLLIVSTVWFLLVVTTPLGFPYSGDPQQPTPMRLLAQHVQRRKYDHEGTVTYEDSGIWYIPFDYAQTQHLMRTMPMMKDGRTLDCSLGPYCALPFLMPVLPLFPTSDMLYIPVDAHNLPPVTCKLTGMKVDHTAFTKMSFEVTGPDHITMIIRPRVGVSLKTWSLTRSLPLPTLMPPDMNETTYFVYYSHGETPQTPWAFSLDFEVPQDYPDKSSIVDLALGGLHLHGKDQTSKQMAEFLATAPDWSVSITWSDTWDGYEF